jgi:hypothetical protein
MRHELSIASEKSPSEEEEAKRAKISKKGKKQTNPQ